LRALSRVDHSPHQIADRFLIGRIEGKCGAGEFDALFRAVRVPVVTLDIGLTPAAKLVLDELPLRSQPAVELLTQVVETIEQPAVQIRRRARR